MPTHNGRWESADDRARRIEREDHLDRTTDFDQVDAVARIIAKERGLERPPTVSEDYLTGGKFYDAVFARINHMREHGA